jgi:hypothetical protein
MIPTAITPQGLTASQHGWRHGVTFVLDQGEMAARFHVDPNPGEAEQPDDDRVASLVIGNLAPGSGGIASPDSSSQRIEI